MKRLTIAAIMAVIAAGAFTGCGLNGEQDVRLDSAQTSGAGNVQEAEISTGGTGTSAAGSGQEAGTADARNTGTASSQTTGNVGGQGTASDIGRDAALQAALNHAGVSQSDTVRLQVSEDMDDGRKVYDIRFDVGQTEYDYEILSTDGQILNSEVENNGRTISGTQNSSGQAVNAAQNVAVSREQAIATALGRVPGATEQDIRIALDYDDGIHKYEGNIIYQQMEYDFEINANSGEVMSWSQEWP